MWWWFSNGSPRWRGRDDDHAAHGQPAAANLTGPGGGVANGERQQAGPRGEFHLVGHGEQRRRGRVGSDDVTLLPVGGRDDHDIGHGGGDGRGGKACGFGERQPVGEIGGALGAQDVPLPGVCGRGGGGVGYGQQLLDSRADHGTVDGYAEKGVRRTGGYRGPRTLRWVRQR